MKKEQFFQHVLTENSTLQEALETLEVIQLQNILFGIRLKEETEERKDVLIQNALKELPMAAEKFAWCLDMERYKMVQAILSQDGVIDASKLSVRKIMAFLEAGMAYPAIVGETRVLVMPKELRQVFDDINVETWEKVAEGNTRILNRIHGLILYYGYLDTAVLMRLCLQKEPEEELDKIYFIELLFAAISYYGIIESEEDGFRHKRFWNFDFMKKEQSRLNIDAYKPISQAVLELAGRTRAVEWTLPMERLKHFLICQGNLTKNGARHVVETAWYDLNNGLSFSDTCEYIWEMHFTTTDSQVHDTLCFYMLQMFYSMPLWLFKGYSFEEMRVLEDKKW